jgi:hypothetical protein
MVTEHVFLRPYEFAQLIVHYQGQRNTHYREQGAASKQGAAPFYTQKDPSRLCLRGGYTGSGGFEFTPIP